MQTSNPFLALAHANSELQDGTFSALSKSVRYRAPDEVLRDARERNSFYKAFVTSTNAKRTPRSVSMSRIQYGDDDADAGVHELQRLTHTVPRAEPLPNIEEPVPLTRTLSRSLNHNTARATRPSSVAFAGTEGSPDPQPPPPAASKGQGSGEDDGGGEMRDSRDAKDAAAAASPLLRAASRRRFQAVPASAAPPEATSATSADDPEASPAQAGVVASRPVPDGQSPLATAIRRMFGPSSAHKTAEPTADQGRTSRMAAASPDGASSPLDGDSSLSVGARRKAALSLAWRSEVVVGEMVAGSPRLPRRSGSSFTMGSRSTGTRTLLQGRCSAVGELPQESTPAADGVECVLDELTGLTDKVIWPPSGPSTRRPSSGVSLSRMGQRMTNPGGAGSAFASPLPSPLAAAAAAAGQAIGPTDHPVSRYGGLVSPSPLGVPVVEGALLSPDTISDMHPHPDPRSSAYPASPFCSPWRDGSLHGDVQAGRQSPGGGPGGNVRAASGPVLSRASGCGRGVESLAAAASNAVVFKAGMPVRKSSELSTEQAARKAVLTGWSARRRQSGNNVRTTGGAGHCAPPDSPAIGPQQQSQLWPQQPPFVRALLAHRGSLEEIGSAGAGSSDGSRFHGLDGRKVTGLSDCTYAAAYPERDSLDGSVYLDVQRSFPSSPAVSGPGSCARGVARALRYD